jgi:hypothetical protein
MAGPSYTFYILYVSVPDPDPDPLVRGVDPDPPPDSDPSIILLSSSKNSKENLDSYCFVTSFGLFSFEKLCKCTFKK